MQDLNDWLNAVKTAKDSVELFRMLDDFRPGQWTDEERALMSKTYIALLPKFEALAFNSDDKKTSDGISVQSAPGAEEGQSQKDEIIDQESVWYERL